MAVTAADPSQALALYKIVANGSVAPGGLCAKLRLRIGNVVVHVV